MCREDSVILLCSMLSSPNYAACATSDSSANHSAKRNETVIRENPHQPAITYDISQLFDYIDTLTDLSVLVFDKENAGYSPYNKDWIKVSYFQTHIMAPEFLAIPS